MESAGRPSASMRSRRPTALAFTGVGHDTRKIRDGATYSRQNGVSAFAVRLPGSCMIRSTSSSRIGEIGTVLPMHLTQTGPIPVRIGAGRPTCMGPVTCIAVQFASLMYPTHDNIVYNQVLHKRMKVRANFFCAENEKAGICKEVSRR